MTARDIRLRAASKANKVHHALGIINLVRNGLERIDIFEALHALEVPVICKPLDGLEGALVLCGNQYGIILSTRTSLYRQRYTAAHELGHYVFEHGLVLDSGDFIGRASTALNVPIKEQEAEAFASEFLCPKILLISVSRQQFWRSRDLEIPDNVYQLSLRLGVSYRATCISLAANDLLPHHVVNKLLSIRPKEIKVHLANDSQPDDYYGDIHVVSRRSPPKLLRVKPNDRVIFDLPEHASAGYMWHLSYEGMEPRTILDHSLYGEGTDVWGRISHRSISLEEVTSGTIRLREARPWDKSAGPADSMDVPVILEQLERGLPRAFRP